MNARWISFFCLHLLSLLFLLTRAPSSNKNQNVQTLLLMNGCPGPAPSAEREKQAGSFLCALS